MICPRCANNKTKVLKTEKSSVNERFRKCDKCNYIFTTIELIKADGYASFYLDYTQKGLFNDKISQA